MKHTITILLLAFLASTAHARFSEFVLVTPGFENPERYKAYISTNPVLTIIESSTNTITVTIPLKDTKQHQQYWVIQCKSALDKNKMDFRQFVWGVDKRSDIEKSVAIRLNPDQKSVAIQIATDAMNRTYIYRDYPAMVMDGGYYYCFDLPAYYKKQQAERPEPYFRMRAF